MVTVPTTHIRISEEAKARLEAHKREGESFTDVVLRLTEPDGDPTEFVGKYDDLGAGVEAVRERMDRDFEDVRR